MSHNGCYLLHLYCDANNPAHAWDEFPHTYTAEEGSTCRKDARRAGWRIYPRTDHAYCPKCRHLPATRDRHWGDDIPACGASAPPA